MNGALKAPKPRARWIKVCRASNHRTGLPRVSRSFIQCTRSAGGHCPAVHRQQQRSAGGVRESHEGAWMGEHYDNSKGCEGIACGGVHLQDATGLQTEHSQLVRADMAIPGLVEGDGHQRRNVPAWGVSEKFRPPKNGVRSPRIGPENGGLHAPRPPNSGAMRGIFGNLDPQNLESI